MNEERLKEGATHKEKLEFKLKCLDHIDNGGVVIDSLMGESCHCNDSHIYNVRAKDLIIIHEPKIEYVPYDETTWQQIPLGGHVEDLHGSKQVITSVSFYGFCINGKQYNYRDAKPCDLTYTSDTNGKMMNGDLAGLPFGVAKEVV